MDQCEPSGDATSVLPSSYSHPSLSPQADLRKNKSGHMGRVAPETGWALEWTRQLHAMHKSSLFWWPFDFSTQMWCVQSLHPASSPGTTSFSAPQRGFWALLRWVLKTNTAHIEHLWTRMGPQNIFGDCEILQASRSLQVSLKYMMKITALNNNLLLPVPLHHFRLCKNICASANTPNHCLFCFVWHSSAHSHREKKRQ